MAEAKNTRPPAGLGNAGRALWRRIVGGLPDGWELDEREQSILRLAARQADDLAKLETVIGREGVMSIGSAGQPVCHPAVAEARQARLAVGKLLGGLDIPAEEAAPGATAAGRHGQQAARTRWDRERQREDRLARQREGTPRG